MKPSLAAALVFTGPLAWALAASHVPSLSSLPDVPAPRSRVTCKAVTAVEQARSCASIEIDLTAARDGTWVLSHDPVFQGQDIPATPSAALKGLVTFKSFVAALRKNGQRLDLLELDVKDGGFSPLHGRLTRVLETNRPALEGLAAVSRVTVLTSPVTARYAEIHRFLARAGLPARGILPGLDIVDYQPEQAARWGYPLAAWQRWLLPVGRLWTRGYYRLYAGRIPFITMQEATAVSWKARPGQRVLCWTRDQPLAEVPEACYLTERGRAS